jgi:hypothetical protein
MGVPATTGQLRTSVNDMQIGDYIPFYEKGQGQGFSFTLNGQTELPLSGVAVGNHYNQYLYMIKVDRGLLIADRILYHSVTWDNLNSWKFINGSSQTINGVSGKVRSLSGGVAYADGNGNSFLTDQGYGAWPTNNEWDKYVVNFPSNKIQPGKTLDDVFHWSGLLTLCQETPVNGFQRRDGYTTTQYNIMRFCRGYQELVSPWYANSTTVHPTVGFRPVFEYKEG